MNELKRLSQRIALGGSASALAMMMGTTNVLAAESTTIAEIVVTAQKRAESLQEVPASVSAIGGDALNRIGVTQLSDISAYMAGLNVSGGGSPGQTTITLRGIAPVGPGAVVGTYINDTPLGGSNNYMRATTFGLDLMPYDIERIEVLRGPQGTLYGAGSMGGLLKYVLKDPDTQNLEFRAGLEGFDVNGAEDIGWGARAGMNLPLGDTVAVRASYFTQTTPGYIDNADTGEEDENEVEQTGGRASLLWQPSDSFSLQVSGFWQRVDSDNNATMTLGLTGIDPPTAENDLGDLVTAHPLAQPFSKDVDYYAATLNWDIGAVEFVSATSFSQTKTIQHTDASNIYGVLYPLLTGGAIPAGLNDFILTLDLEKWTQEFRLSSTGEGRLQWRVGAFYTEEDSTNMQESIAMDAQGQLIPAFAPYFAFASLPSKYKETAVFGDMTFKFTDSFDVTAGLRWASNDQDFRQISGGAIIPTADDPGTSDESVTTYALSPRWHISDDTMVYLRVASGYRPGGPNIIALGLPPSVDSDQLTNYEAGLKTELLDGRALMNVAVFYIDWEDIQQAQAFGGVSGLGNAGDAESQGVEFESLFAVSDGFRLGFNFSYTEATLKSDVPGGDNTLGHQLPGVPEWTGALTADYSFKVFGDRDAHIGAGWRYVDERESQVVTNTDNLSYVLPSYDAIDVNADVSFGALTARLYVKNLTDERGYIGGGTVVNGLNIPIYVDVNVLQPRTVGLSLDVQF